MLLPWVQALPLRQALFSTSSLKPMFWGIRRIKICLCLALEQWVRVEEVESTSWVMFPLFSLFSLFSFPFFVCLFVCSFVRLFVCLLAHAYVREGKCCKFLQMKNLQVRFLQTQKQDFFAFCATCCNIFICRNLHIFWSAFCEFCWCFCCKVMQYRACQ